MTASPPVRFLLAFAVGTVVFGVFLFERLGWTGSWRISKDPDDYR